jgi:hypothetical protein
LSKLSSASLSPVWAGVCKMPPLSLAFASQAIVIATNRGEARGEFLGSAYWAFVQECCCLDSACRILLVHPRILSVGSQVDLADSAALCALSLSSAPPPR